MGNKKVATACITQPRNHFTRSKTISVRLNSGSGTGRAAALFERPPVGNQRRSVKG
jgi:hypothetical protein